MSVLSKLTATEAKLFFREPSALIGTVVFPAAILLALGAVPALREPSEEYDGARFIELWAPTALMLGVEGWHAPEQAWMHLDKALGLAKDGLAEARRSVQALRPRQLDGTQLPEALGDLARRWAGDADVGAQIDVTGDPVPLSPALEVVLFRVAQEALTNVGKHAGASRVGVTLSYLGDMVLLDVRDDGAGMPNGTGHGFGLNSMRQRVRSVGRTVNIESTPGEGTAVCASVPAITVEST